MRDVKNQPKYKIGESVRVMGNRKINYGEIVAVADDDSRWIHSGERTYIYAIDVSADRNKIKNKLFKLLKIAGYCEVYRENEINSKELKI